VQRAVAVEQSIKKMAICSTCSELMAEAESSDDEIIHEDSRQTKNEHALH
jgi:cytidine deaminase